MHSVLQTLFDMKYLVESIFINILCWLTTEAFAKQWKFCPNFKLNFVLQSSSFGNCVDHYNVTSQAEQWPPFNINEQFSITLEVQLECKFNGLKTTVCLHGKTNTIQLNLLMHKNNSKAVNFCGLFAVAVQEQFAVAQRFEIDSLSSNRFLQTFLTKQSSHDVFTGQIFLLQNDTELVEDVAMNDTAMGFLIVKPFLFGKTDKSEDLSGGKSSNNPDYSFFKFIMVFCFAGTLIILMIISLVRLIKRYINRNKVYPIRA